MFKTQATAEDPVCYMQVDKQEAEARGLVSEHQGARYYFCSQMCKEQFEKFTDRFLGRLGREKETGHGG